MLYSATDLIQSVGQLLLAGAGKILKSLTELHSSLATTGLEGALEDTNKLVESLRDVLTPESLVKG